MSTEQPGPRSVDLLVMAATGGELGWLGVKEGWAIVERGSLTVASLVSGPGPGNSAMAFAAAIERVRPALVLSVGIGGAFNGSGLKPGNVAIASREIDLDWGVEGEGVARSPLSIPRFRVGGVDYHNTFEASGECEQLLVEACPPDLVARGGTFVTSATVTASAERAEAIEAEYSPICENMEGAQLAACATLFGATFAEVRGISNMVGPRDLGSWKFKEAMESAGRCAASFLDLLSDQKSSRRNP